MKPDPDGPGFMQCEAAAATYVELNFPGPLGFRILPVSDDGRNRSDGPTWRWNRDPERPTLTPSIRTRSATATCHSFVTDGQARFLTDCTHELAGRTLDLRDVE